MLFLLRGKCLDIQMILQTDHITDQTFRRCKLSPTEQLVKYC